MSIHFKFKSAKKFDTVAFPGAVIRVLDLKMAIVEKAKLANGIDLDMVITDAHNGKMYDDENMELPCNTIVIVKRIPSLGPGKGLLARMKNEAAAAVATASQSPVLLPGVPQSYHPLGSFDGGGGGSGAGLTDGGGAQTLGSKLAALHPFHERAEDLHGVRSAGNKMWTSSAANNLDEVSSNSSPGGDNYTGGSSGRGGRGGDVGGGGGEGEGLVGLSGNPMMGGAYGSMTGMVGKPPPNYVCFRCGTPGHYIENCPTNGNSEFDDHKARKKPLKDLEPFLMAVGDLGASKTRGSAKLEYLFSTPPDHLACPICMRLINKAMLTPCCSESACDECLPVKLIDNKLTCPLCATPNVSPDKLFRNKVLRMSVEQYLFFLLN